MVLTSYTFFFEKQQELYIITPNFGLIIDSQQTNQG